MDKTRKLIYQGSVPIGYYEGGSAVLDVEFWGCSEGRELARAGVVMTWLPDIAKQLKLETEGEQNDGRRVRIYQLMAATAPEKKFITYRKLYEQYGGAHRTDYHLVFDGRLAFDSLDGLYELLSADVLPKGYTGRRLSMSDVIGLCDEGRTALYYVDADDYVYIEWEENEHEKE